VGIVEDVQLPNR